jgi:hypothetical protein
VWEGGVEHKLRAWGRNWIEDDPQQGQQEIICKALWKKVFVV